MDLEKGFKNNEHGNHLDSIEKKLTSIILLMRTTNLILVVLISILVFFVIRLQVV